MNMSMLAPALTKVIRFSALSQGQSRASVTRGEAHVASRTSAVRIASGHEADVASSAASAVVRPVAKWSLSRAEGGLACHWELLGTAA